MLGLCDLFWRGNIDPLMICERLGYNSLNLGHHLNVAATIGIASQTPDDNLQHPTGTLVFSLLHREADCFIEGAGIGGGIRAKIACTIAGRTSVECSVQSVCPLIRSAIFVVTAARSRRISSQMVHMCGPSFTDPSSAHNRQNILGCPHGPVSRISA